MKEARLKILEMVSEQKISVEEGVRLLNACDKSSHNSSFEFDTRAFEEKAKEFSKSAEKFAKDAKNKASDFYKDVEPRLKKGVKVAVEKTVAIVDEISNALNDTLCSLNNGYDSCCDDFDDDDCCCCGEGHHDDKPVDNGPPPEKTE